MGQGVPSLESRSGAERKAATGHRAVHDAATLIDDALMDRMVEAVAKTLPLSPASRPGDKTPQKCVINAVIDDILGGIQDHQDGPAGGHPNPPVLRPRHLGAGLCPRTTAPHRRRGDLGPRSAVVEGDPTHHPRGSSPVESAKTQAFVLKAVHSRSQLAEGTACCGFAGIIALHSPGGARFELYGGDKLSEELGGRPTLLRMRTVEFFAKRDDVLKIIVAGQRNVAEADDGRTC